MTGGLMDHTKAAVTLRDRAAKAGWRVQLTSVTGEATSAYLWRGATVDPVEARISFRELAAEVKR
jgi:hypothetical protein